jgi:hypothetical protein
MATSLSEVQAVLNKELQEPLADLVARSNPVLAGIQKKAVASDAIYLKAQSASDHGAGPITDGSDVTFAGTEKATFIAPTLPWSTYISKFSVPKRLIDQVRNTPGSIGEILRHEISEAAKDLADRLSTDLFGGVTANGLVGLQAIADDGNTYAGIDRSLAANSNWRAVVVDAEDPGTPGSALELSTDLLYQLDQAYFDRNKVGFDLNPLMYTGIATAPLMTRYKALMETINYGSLSTAHFVNQANASGFLGVGKTGFMGIPFIRDAANVAAGGDIADTGRLYILDMQKVHLCTLVPSQDGAIHQMQGYSVAPSAEGINMSIELLGNTGESIKGYVKTYVQLATPDPAKATALLKNVNVA